MNRFNNEHIYKTSFLDNCPEHYTLFLFSNAKSMELFKHKTGLGYKQWLSLD